MKIFYFIGLATIVNACTSNLKEIINTSPTNNNQNTEPDSDSEGGAGPPGAVPKK